MSKTVSLLNGPNNCADKVSKLLDLVMKYNINLDTFENAMCATEKSSELFTAYDKELAGLNRKYSERIAQLSLGDKEAMSKMLETYDEKEFKKYVDMDESFSRIKVHDIKCE